MLFFVSLMKKNQIYLAKPNKNNNIDFKSIFLLIINFIINKTFRNQTTLFFFSHILYMYIFKLKLIFFKGLYIFNI